MRRSRWAILALALGLGGLLLTQKSDAAVTSSFLELIPLPGYTGAPAPPTSFAAGVSAGWINIGAEGSASVQIMDASGADGVGTVNVETRDCPTCVPYIQATCTNPPDQTVSTTRCDFSLADAYQVRLTVPAAGYTSGTWRGVLRTKTVL